MGLNKKADWVYVNFEEGSFRAEGESYPSVDGILEQISHFWKPIKGFNDKHVLRITLGDPQENLKYSIEAGMETQFGRMFAGHLAGIAAGEHIVLETHKNDRTKGGSCFVRTVNGGGQETKVPYTSIKDNALAIAEVEKHQAYVKYVPKQPQETSGNVSATDPFAQFVAGLTASAWPPYALHRTSYETWFHSLMRNVQGWSPSDIDDAGWLYFHDCQKRHAASGAPLPKSLRDIKVDEYDPFSEE